MELIDIARELFDYLVAFRRRISLASAPHLDIVRHDLELIFYTMEEKISNHSSLINEYRQVKYPLVVLADEIILTSAWPHARQWEQCLLEKKYFSSNIGGNQFFKLLSKVDHMPSSVVKVYFYCLAFGFRGGFSQNDPSLFRLKGRLLQRILPSKTEKGDVILPEAYRVETSSVEKLPKVWRWSHVVVASVILLFFVLALERFVVWPLIIGQSLESGATLETAMEDPETGSSSQTGGPTVEATPSGYAVQLGLFSSEALAKHFSQQIEIKNIKTRIHYKIGNENKNSYLVLSGVFADKKDAMRLLEEAKTASSIVSEMSVITWEEASGDCIYGCD